MTILAALARLAEPYRTERVATLAILALVWLAGEHPGTAPESAQAIVWVVAAVAGRSAAHAASRAAERRAKADPAPPVV
jgi:hypothetical protein